MRSNRLSLRMPVALVVLLVAACSTNHSADSTAPIYLTENIPTGVADVDISVAADVTIPSMTINSHAKSPSGVLSGQDDVILDLWVITPQRSDGGTVASPQYRVANLTTYVAAGGSASLQNYRIFPAEYFQQPPLNQLYPQNGGVDKETGKCNIRQTLHIEIFGKTVSGHPVSLAFDNALNFFYVTPSCSTP
jgi:hypothetical protein